MSQHKAYIRWNRSTPDFNYDTYDRTHSVRFEGGIEIKASAAAEYKGDAQLVNPEEQLVAALSTCHMLTFLAIASKSKLTVDSYEDDAVGVLEKNESGKLAVTRCTLQPKIKWSGAIPSNDKVHDMHQSAHRNCFIANSVNTKIQINVPGVFPE